MNNKEFPRFTPNIANPKKLPAPPRSGSISGFPAPPAPKPAPQVVPPVSAPPVPKTYPAPPVKLPLSTPSVPKVEPKKEPEIPETMKISDAEIEDLYDHRAARNVKYLPEEQIYRVAGSSDPVVRKELAINPSTPSNILLILAQDADEQVREEVAFNPSTPAEAFDILSRDRSTFVIEALITSKVTPFSVLKKIKVNPNDTYLLDLLAKRGL